MEEATRKRIMRQLEGLPEEQLYEVLDYIEFLAWKYARESGRKPDVFQQFVERVEDQMRVRSLAPKAMKGTMKVMSTAGKVLDGVRSIGKDLVMPADRTEVVGGGGRGGSEGPAEPVGEGGGATVTGPLAEESMRDGDGMAEG